MTKYGHYLAALDRDCPITFRGKFICYKGLKKVLKQCQVQQQATAATAADGPDDSAAAVELCSKRFFDLLREELFKTNRCFVSTAKGIVAAFQRTEVRRRLACCFPRLLGVGPAHYAHLADRAYWCCKYAKANAVALRKILKKHDKLCGGQRGRNFLQFCWRLPSGGAFLHSPLLDELKAIQDMLHQQRMQQQQDEDIALCEVADTSAKGGSKAVAAMAAAAAAAAATATGCAGGQAQPCTSVGSSCAMQLPPLQQLEGSECGLHTQRSEAAVAGMGAAIGSPSCMLSSSDFEWVPEEAGGGTSSCPMATPGSGRHLTLLARPSLDTSVLSASTSTACFSPGTSPPWPGASSGGALLLLRGGSAAFVGPADTATGARASVPAAVQASGAGASAADASGNTREPGSVAVAGSAPPRAAQKTMDRACVSRFKDEDLRCPICLEVFYKPVGLVCGHKFCKRCALEWASLGNAIGTFANLCSYVAPSVACPQCRQPGVFKGAVRVRMLDRVLRSRFPAEWEERRQEEREMKSSVVEVTAGPSHHRHWMQTLNAREALLGM